MANFLTAFEWMMNFEDPRKEYAQVPDAPPGAFAISGINSAAFPSDFEIIQQTPQAERAGAVQAFYNDEFWNQWLGQIESNEVAKRVFDAAVNMGPGTAVKILQRAILQIDPDAALDVDGAWGPHTIMRVNLEKEEAMTVAFCSQRVDHYQQIVASHPANEKHLAGWLARAQA